MASEMKNARRTTPRKNNLCEKNRPNQNNINTLIEEIKLLKKDIADKEYIIDDLVLERDQISDAKYALRIKYEDAMIQLAEANRIIKNLENERVGLKKEVEYLNDDVITSLVAEEISGRERENRRSGKRTCES